MQSLLRAPLLALLAGLAGQSVACAALQTRDADDLEMPAMSSDSLEAYENATSATPFEEYVSKRIGDLPTDISAAGRESLLRRKELHDQLIDDEGFGLYYGTEGSWRPKTDAPDLKHPMMGSNCFAWTLEVTSSAFKAAGKTRDWSAVSAVIRKDVRGTTLARVLQDKGWTVIYWNPDVEHPVDGGAWKGNYNVAAKHGGYYAKMGGPKRVDDVIVNYQPNPLESTVQDTSAYDKLKNVDFYFGVTEGGTHTFVGSRGLVSEMHWTADGNEKKALEEVELKDWFDDDGVASGGRRSQWSEGLLVIPPGVWTVDAQ